ncbi:MAG TPA: cytochrome c-type biogenesis protein CcmH [Gammaproteobacteria bacterium]|nr:cytochrome C biogenesis protein CcmH [Acidiferrobacteraceae bacterium]HCX86838.1 cytochrome c-type biogenesis protein CcmH [Gammaproteobacteria bacterium]
MLAGILILGLSSPAPAVIETYEFSDPAQEARYQNMIAELRCLVCQNQNLADSNAGLAKDLRARTYEMISAGATDDEIVEFMVARYGDFVLYRPPLRLRTVLLWLGPFAILLVALGIFFFTVRKSRAVSVMSEQERENAARLLDRNP